MKAEKLRLNPGAVSQKSKEMFEGLIGQERIRREMADRLIKGESLKSIAYNFRMRHAKPGAFSATPEIGRAFSDFFGGSHSRVREFVIKNRPETTTEELDSIRYLRSALDAPEPAVKPNFQKI